jgi:hypothetical protein
MSFTTPAGTRQQSFPGPSPAGLMITFYCLRFETPTNLEGQIPQEQGGPVIPSNTEFPFRRLLRLAGLRSRYSNPLLSNI